MLKYFLNLFSVIFFIFTNFHKLYSFFSKKKPFVQTYLLKMFYCFFCFQLLFTFFVTFSYHLFKKHFLLFRFIFFPCVCLFKSFFLFFDFQKKYIFF